MNILTASEPYLHFSNQSVKSNPPQKNNGEAINRPPHICQVVSTGKLLLSNYLSARAAWAAASRAIGTRNGEQDT